MKHKFKLMDEVVIDAVSNIVEFQNDGSDHSVERIRRFTECLGTGVMRLYPEYGLTPAKLSAIVCVAAIHDIGKMAIPESILQKPGKLTKEEMDTVKFHTVVGVDLVRELIHLHSTMYNDYCCDIVRHHHERYDGKGYPDGLVGDEISIGAQIVALADVYDALIHERPYKCAYTPQEAYDTIMNGECGAFSEKLLDVLRAVKRQMEDLAIFFKSEEAAEHDHFQLKAATGF